MTTPREFRITWTWQRALYRWQLAFLNWWSDTGPVDSSSLEVYLRTAISVERDGWANFGYVRMPEYRWGIFLIPRDETRSALDAADTKRNAQSRGPSAL